MAAAERPSITWPDLLALLRDELAADDAERGEPVEAWLERECFEPDALVEVARFLTSTWIESGQTIYSLTLLAFTSGWSAHRGLRGERAG